MRKMILMFGFLFALTGPVLAGTAQIEGWDNLNDQQKAQIALDVANKAAQAAAPSAPEQVEKWIQVGKNVGVGFAAAAKELGVGIDTLMASSTGKIVMFLIVWNYIGDQLVGIIGGFIWFLVMLPAWNHYFKKLILQPVTAYHENGKKAKVFNEGSWKTAPDSIQAIMVIAIILIVVAGFVMIFA